MSLGCRFERRDFTPASVCEEDVDVTVLLFHDGKEPVQILQARYIARDRSDVSPDQGGGFFQLFLSSAGDHDLRAFFHEALGCGQANPAVSAGDDRNFSCQFLSVIITHILLFGFVPGDFENADLRFSAKADIVIEFAEFEPGFDVFPGF
jgi:hypothetical protein